MNVSENPGTEVSVLECLSLRDPKLSPCSGMDNTEDFRADEGVLQNQCLLKVLELK